MDIDKDGLVSMSELKDYEVALKQLDPNFSGETGEAAAAVVQPLASPETGSAFLDDC